MRTSTHIFVPTRIATKLWCFLLLLRVINSRNAKKMGDDRIGFLDFCEFSHASGKERKNTKNDIVVWCRIRGLESDRTQKKCYFLFILTSKIVSKPYLPHPRRIFVCICNLHNPYNIRREESKNDIVVRCHLTCFSPQIEVGDAIFLLKTSKTVTKTYL